MRHETGETDECPRKIEGPFRISETRGWRDDHTCAYCGSLSAEKFMEAVASGAKLIPTDKDYKAYIDTPQRSHQKFYFQHLSKEACLKFIDLLREQKINFAEPGHFYVKPYFIAYGPLKGEAQ